MYGFDIIVAMNKERFYLPEDSEDKGRAVSAIIEAIQKLEGGNYSEHANGLAQFGGELISRGQVEVTNQEDFIPFTDFGPKRDPSTGETSPRIIIGLWSLERIGYDVERIPQSDVLRTLVLCRTYPRGHKAPLPKLYTAASIQSFWALKNGRPSDRDIVSIVSSVFFVLGQERYYSGFGFAHWKEAITHYAEINGNFNPYRSFSREMLTNFLFAREMYVPFAHEALLQKLGTSYLTIPMHMRHMLAAQEAVALYLAHLIGNN